LELRSALTAGVTVVIANITSTVFCDPMGCAARCSSMFSTECGPSGSIQRTRTPGGDSKRSWDSNRSASDYRPALEGYLDRTTATGPGKHTPHLLGEALSWHVRYLYEGAMGPG
jgi:hypothetical protein